MAEDKQKLNIFPLAPFLLSSINKEGNKNHFVVDSFDGGSIEKDDNGRFIQAIIWVVHKATEDEKDKFIGEM